MLLFINQVAVAFFVVVDLYVKIMDRAFKFGRFILRYHNARLTVITLLAAHPKLIVHCGSAVHESGALAFKDLNTRLLSKALMLPLGEGAVVLVDGGLLVRADLLLFVTTRLERVTFALNRLVLSDRRLNVLVQFADFHVTLANFGLDSLDLLRDFNRFLRLLLVHRLKMFELILEAADDCLLAVKLRLEVLFQSGN